MLAILLSYNMTENVFFQIHPINYEGFQRKYKYMFVYVFDSFQQLAIINGMHKPFAIRLLQRS